MTPKTVRLAAAVLAVFALVLTPPPPAWCQNKGNEPSTKVKKQIEVMESILDKVLVDSPNLLVGSQSATRGLYLPEFGVLFSFETNLLSHDGGEWWKNWDWEKFQIRTEGKKTIIELPGDEDEDSTDAEGGKKRPRTDEERYDAGKAELVEALLDYGETLTGLGDAQWVGIVLFFDDEEEIGDREISTVLIKAKMADLRAHASERLSQRDMESRVVIDEY